MNRDNPTAAFFLPKKEDTQDLVPLSQNLEAIKGGSVLSPVMANAVAKAAEDFRFLHWHLAFPEAMEAGGFDCALGNPPWERIKLQEKEFFAARSEAIATAPNKAARERLIQQLRSETASQSDRLLVQEFELSKREAEGSCEFIRGSGRYSLTAVGDLNTYALFAELFTRLICPDGRTGAIVPSGIATDFSCRLFFGNAIKQKILVSFLGFDNALRIFPSVHPDTPFSLITLGGIVEEADFTHYLLQVQDLSDDRRHFRLCDSSIRTINPNTRTCPIFRSKMDASLCAQIHTNVPVLVNDELGENGNPWKARVHSRLFHMAEDSHHFASHYETDMVSLYEAKLMHIYDHRWATFDLNGSSREVSENEKKNVELEIKPRYWVRKSEVESRLLAQDWKHKWLMGWRDITNATNERTVIFCVLLFSAIGHTIPTLYSNATLTLLPCIAANFSTLVLDFCARNKIGGTHLTYSCLKQLPINPPSSYSKSAVDFIHPRVLELTYTAHDLKPWAEDLGYDGPPFLFDPERRALLRSELDAFYAHLYGLNRDELRYILDPADVMGPDYPSETFRVLKNNEMRQFGEYRTQRLVLEAWDRLFGGG